MRGENFTRFPIRVIENKTHAAAWLHAEEQYLRRYEGGHGVVLPNHDLVERVELTSLHDYSLLLPDCRANLLGPPPVLRRLQVEKSQEVHATDGSTDRLDRRAADFVLGIANPLTSSSSGVAAVKAHQPSSFRPRAKALVSATAQSASQVGDPAFERGILKR